MNKYFSLLSVLFSLLLLLSCGKEGDEENEGNGISSTYSSAKSHNLGRNCLSCHSFKAAGTVYTKSFAGTYPGATVKITSQPNGAGTLLATIEVDQRGNFYTGRPLNFGNGNYVSVTGITGNTKHMGSAVTTGACNSCHGSSTSKIWAE